MLQYRLDRVGAARAKARSYHASPPYSGIMFPWESAKSGAETCPTWATTGLYEQHISADIALAARQYLYATGDDEWLHKGGLDMIAGIADFWISRVSNDTDGYHIRGVIPPDEYAPPHGVDDDPYTCYAVSEALLFAAEASARAGKRPDPKWAEVARSLPVLFDEATRRHPEYSGYKWNTKIKQADVILLSYPLGLEMSREVRQHDLEYYEGVTDAKGPAMTWGMHALGHLELGDAAKAAANFNRSFANVKWPFDIWTETPAGGVTNFITGAGGFLQTVLFVYAGVRVHKDYLEVSPKLLEGARSMSVQGIRYRGSAFSVDYTERRIKFTLLTGPALKVTCSGGSEQLLTRWQPLQFDVGPTALLLPAIWSPSRSVRFKVRDATAPAVKTNLQRWRRREKAVGLAVPPPRQPFALTAGFFAVPALASFAVLAGSRCRRRREGSAGSEPLYEHFPVMGGVAPSTCGVA